MMARALLLGARGLDTASPNPSVGCVIARGGRILGEGWEASAKTFAAPPEETIWFSLVRRTSPT